MPPLTRRIRIAAAAGYPASRGGKRNERSARRNEPRPALIALLWLFAEIAGCAAFAFSAFPVMAQAQPRAIEAGPTIVVGFLGGFVHSDDSRHTEVQLADRLRAAYGNSVHVEIFENRHRAEAHKTILKWLDRNGDGQLSEEEKEGARIILLGHSWGASTVISLARQLELEGIPVELTIQVDSVSKDGEKDSLIPANVAEAVNFYQSRGFLHGASTITAADPAHTHLLGNFHLQYQKQPAECHAFPWYDRFLSKGHIAIECDPRLWLEIETLIRERLSPGPPADAPNSANSRVLPGGRATSPRGVSLGGF